MKSKKTKKLISLNLTNRRVEKEERQSWALDIENKDVPLLI